MKKILVSTTAIAGLVAGVSAVNAQNSEPVQIAGSSTVLPYAQIVVENFGESYPEFPTPILESGGTGGGLRQFCAGVGSDTLDVANASRQISDSEIETCNSNGVTEIHEAMFGYDGIVFAYANSGPDMNLTPQIVYQALAQQVVQDGEVVDNPYQQLSDIDSSLPDWDIAMYIPASNHGTREVFEDKLLLQGCEESGAMQAFMDSGMDEDAAEEQCLTIRQGQFATEISGDYTETLARIQSNQTGIGVFGLAFYEQNTDQLKVATIEDVEPTAETIAAGDYPVSRPLYFYVKLQHIGTIPGLEDYVSFFLDDQMIGPNGPLAQYGLVAAPESERQEQRQQFEDRETIGSSQSQ